RITSNCMCPGAVDTPMWKQIDADWTTLEGWERGEAWKRRTAGIPLGRPEVAEDLTGLAVFLASADSDYMTGPAVKGDGGLVMGDQVGLVREDRVATVTLNRPDRRNSLSDAMLTELATAFTVLRDDAEIRAVVVTGAPPVFSAGADAPLRSTMSADERRRAFLQRQTQFRRLFERATTLLESLEQATIALNNGTPVGGGWGLTLACDFRWAAAEAEFWIPEVDLG